MFRRSRTKSKKKPAAARKSGPRLIERLNWLTIRRSLVILAWLIASIALVGGWIKGVPRLEQYASAHALPAQSDTAPAVQVRFVDLPAWVTPDLKSRLTLTAQQQLGGDPLARRDLAAARDALLSSGWFERIDQVRRLDTDLVEVHAKLADPFALVRDEKGDHLVDRDGRLLPYSFPPGSKSRLVVITGAHFKRPTQLRHAWEGDDLAAALRVLRLIDDRPWREQLRAIDVSQYLPKERLRLITDRDTAILWGRAPGDERVAEVPAQQKISYLDRLHARTGRVDGGFGTEVDVSGDRVSIPDPTPPAEDPAPAKPAPPRAKPARSH